MWMGAQHIRFEIELVSADVLSVCLFPPSHMKSKEETLKKGIEASGLRSSLTTPTERLLQASKPKRYQGTTAAGKKTKKIARNDGCRQDNQKDSKERRLQDGCELEPMAIAIQKSNQNRRLQDNLQKTKAATKKQSKSTTAG